MQRVFLTGASSGIGEALARCYAEQGASLGLAARRGEVLDALRQSLPHPERHRVYALDVNDHQALQAAAQDFLAQHGGVDVVVANAGVSHGTLTEHAEDLPVFEQIIATNLLATVATFSPFVAAMRAQGAGRLVGIASVAGIRGLPGAGAYSASKAATISYCESLRVELHGSGVKVVTIAPGYIDTPMTQHNAYPMPFLMEADAAARRVCDGLARGGFEIRFPRRFAYAVRLVQSLPYPLFFALFRAAGLR